MLAVFGLLGAGFLALSVPILRTGRFPGWMARRPALMWPLKRTGPRIARLQGWAGKGTARRLIEKGYEAYDRGEREKAG